MCARPYVMFCEGGKIPSCVWCAVKSVVGGFEDMSGSDFCGKEIFIVLDFCRSYLMHSFFFLLQMLYPSRV